MRLNFLMIFETDIHRHQKKSPIRVIAQRSGNR